MWKVLERGENDMTTDAASIEGMGCLVRTYCLHYHEKMVSMIFVPGVRLYTDSDGHSSLIPLK